ncbi:hypothetical protein C9374_005217 [Naegleria lovaniensis]|uniref:non-specific serine/threonine protein kinase n=1 Tax=Naegleria lovaniensis TaxID=51637 RepID=A0AA88KIV9_NAELO|nr:uncharacterized protein C9374_005217 [Naegleria lovaniensis]KAG2382637.1 hypothetical protein C9374_005217 [Naegleria lovaniensis]
MGNQLAVSGSVQELHLQDLAEGLVQDHPLGGGRLLKSVQCWTEEGMPVVVKVYLKREDDPPLALAPHHAKLKILNEKLSLRNQPNVLSYNRMVETDKAGYLVRQYCYSNLADRISTRPFFSAIGKRWIAFQILQGLSQIHKLGLYHGDLKADNVILTAWDWVFLTDLAPFKPSRIPDDDPSFFSYYFDTSGRRICLLAPERFCPTSQVSGIGASASATPLASTKSLANAFVMIDNNGLDQSMVINEDTLSPPSGSNQSSSESNSNNTSSNNTEEITEKMDIFSAGCVIAQLFLDGEALFDYSQLLAYRKGDTEHFSKLMERVEDKDVREMITHMLDLDPNKRLSAEEYITKYTPTIFPIYFKYIHEKVMIQMLDKNCDKRIQTIAEMYNSIIDELSEHSEISKSPSSQIVSSTMIKTGQKSSDTLNAQNATEYTGYIQKNSLPELISDTKKFNHNSDDAENKEKAPSSNNKIEKLSERRKFNNGKKLGKSQTTHEGIEIIATLLCSSVRNAQSVSVRVQGLDLMKKLADFSSNYTKLERLIPYTCALLNDQAPLVKSKAIDTLTYILTKITAFPPSDSNLFNDYILPALKIICTDKSDLVRVTFAENLPLLAYQARRFLEMSQIINQNINNQVMIKGTYDSELNSLQDEIGSRVLELSMDQCTVVKRSLLKNITPLCIFYGRRKTNDFVLPMVITFLNSRQWRLRHAFFEQIVGISIFVGPTSLKEFILPCIMQALYDVQEFVIDQALNGLVALCELGMFEKSTIVDIAKKVSYLLYHPNTWIRYNAIAFFSAASKQLGMADTSCFLLDILKPHLAQSIMIITEYSLLESLPQTTNEEVDKLEVILPYLSQVATAILSKSWENNNDGENQSSNDSGGVVQLNLPLFTHFTPIESPYISLQSSIAQNNQAPSKPSQSKQYNNEWNTFFSMSGKPKSKTKDNDEFPKNITNPLLKASTIGKWRPNGNLFGQSTEHKGSINEISVHDSLYWFVTGGNDGTVRLWDLTNTERDFAMNSKMTYTIIQGGGRVNSVAILNVSSPLIAACTDKGWIHVFSADLGTTMYTITISDSGAIFVQSSTGSKTQEASINVVRPLNIGNQPLLVCGNQNGMVVGIDPRAAREAFSWKSKEALEQGPISEICCGDNEPWVISSTKRGFLTLWDLRYQISVSNTRINDSAINRISICKNSVLTSSFSSPSVYIASQNNDINLWNLETQQTLFRFRCSDTRKKSQSTPYTTPNIEQPYGSSDKFAIGEIKKIMKDRKQFSTEEPTFDINALYVNDYDGCFYSGSSDGIVRFWDVNKIDQSYVVSGASQQAFVYGAKKEDNCTVFTEDVMSLQRTDQSLTSSTTSNRGKGGTFSQPIATHHLDTITDIEVVSGVSKGHFQPLLLTASRDGMLKVWK